MNRIDELQAAALASIAESLARIVDAADEAQADRDREFNMALWKASD